ncbi:hypothetical protein C8R28_105317 [Nitrosomonas ureae]|uniref:Uncharacterized protein n=1 Tax=Nitrosomonas ureae TaxID=44577 RepID=A0A2T5I631_9PROT|nr:hypothetical protein C8R28_105317 [Nitrosomonas ureae]
MGFRDFTAFTTFPRLVPQNVKVRIGRKKSRDIFGNRRKKVEKRVKEVNRPQCDAGQRKRNTAFFAPFTTFTEAPTLAAI